MTALASGLALIVVGAPAVLMAVLGAASLIGWRFSEGVVGTLAKVAFVISLASCLALAGGLATGDVQAFSLDVVPWLGEGRLHFGLGLLVDPLSLTFATLTTALCGLVAAFAHRYLHREPGYNRFFVLLALFSLGMLLTVMAGSIEMLFGAWEFVGLSSALLIAFYHDRRTPVENGFRTFAVYRICDLGLLGAVVLVHHHWGTGDFDALFGTGQVPAAVTGEAGPVTAVALLLLLAAIGKSALLPVSGWLPRAMEGPTPSSAIFYGALSVHAGAFLLLRVRPFLQLAPVVSGLVVAIGLLTAAHAAIIERTRPDIKTALAYASLTQVGIIVAEIGAGLRLLPLIHIVGHACSRSLQLLRAPSLLHDLHQAEAAVGGHLAHTGLRLEERLPPAAQRRLYRLALDRANLDEFLDRWVVEPFLRVFRGLDRFERRVVGLVADRRPPGGSA